MENVTTVSATPNIAFVKYWGKRDDQLNLPTNSSLSMTMDDRISTRTSVLISSELEDDKFYLNGELQKTGADSDKNAYVKKMIGQMRALAGIEARALVVSKNYFPTASGMASSASGSAALVFALSTALKLNLNPMQMSTLSRQISGSACRSLFGGIVKWNVGVKSDGSDSNAEQVFDENYWPELTDVIAVVNPGKKKVSSSEGHSLTPKTSVLYKARVPYAENLVVKMVDLIREKDFGTLALMIMKESNNLHATMLDSWPPIIYLNDGSNDVIFKVHELNAAAGENIAGYTFDAGSNAHVITTAGNKATIISGLKEIEQVTGTLEAISGSGPKVLTEKESLIGSDLSPKM